jgi:hypothetical protein
MQLFIPNLIMHSLWESLALYLVNLGKVHWQVAKHTPRYLKSITSLGIKYQQSITSDWVGDKNTHCSTFGYCFFLFKVIISWGSKKQTSMALSNIDLKYMAISKATTKKIWL